MSHPLILPIVAALLAAGLLSSGCEKEAPAEHSAEQVEEAADEADLPAVEEKAEAVEEAAGEAAEEEGAAAQGQWVESPTYGVKFRVPSDWQIAREEASVSATAPDGTTTVLMVGSESESVIQSAVQEIQKEVEFKDVTIGKSDMTVVNGLAGYKGTGSAVLVREEGDQEIEFIAYSLKVGDKAVSLMIFSEAEMYEAQREMIEGIGQTITRF